MLLLIHGGLWDKMDADRFWHKPGNVTGLQCQGFDALHRLLPQAIALPGCPEPPRPDFPPYVGPFVRTVTEFVAS